MLLKARELSVRFSAGTIALKIWGDVTEAACKFLAVHGWLDNAGSFDPLMPQFLNKRNDRCVVCVDLPGHGWSSHHPKGIPYTPASELLVMRNVIKHLGWNKFHLLGHSMGGMRCQQYALSWPHELESVILLDGFVVPTEFSQFKLDPENTPFLDFGRQTDSYLKFISEYHGRNKEYTWEELTERRIEATPDLTMDELKVLMKRGATRLENGMYVYTRDPALQNRQNIVMMHTTETIMEAAEKCPARHLLISAKGGPSAMSASMSHNFFKMIGDKYPNKLEIVKVEGSHHVHMQQPDMTASIMNEFLDKMVTKAVYPSQL